MTRGTLQAVFAGTITCAVCSMTHSAQLADRRAHDAYHRDFVQGISWRRVGDPLEWVGKVGVYAVDVGRPREVKGVETLLAMANRELKAPPGSDEWRRREKRGRKETEMKEREEVKKGNIIRGEKRKRDDDKYGAKREKVDCGHSYMTNMEDISRRGIGKLGLGGYQNSGINEKPFDCKVAEEVNRLDDTVKGEATTDSAGIITSGSDNTDGPNMKGGIDVAGEYSGSNNTRETNTTRKAASTTDIHNEFHISNREHTKREPDIKNETVVEDETGNKDDHIVTGDSDSLASVPNSTESPFGSSQLNHPDLQIDPVPIPAKAFVALAQNRAIGLVVTEPVAPSQSKWMVHRTQTIVPRPSGARVGISRIWVAPSWRRHGIARGLLQAVANHSVYGMVLPPRQIAFSQPSHAGGLLAVSFNGARHKSGEMLVPVYEEI